MNKYQEALDILSHIAKNQGYEHCIDNLQELVDKVKPRMPIPTSRYSGRHNCPNCKNQLPLKENCMKKKAPRLYCDRCGQRIDWSKVRW